MPVHKTYRLNHHLFQNDSKKVWLSNAFDTRWQTDKRVRDLIGIYSVLLMKPYTKCH